MKNLRKLFLIILSLVTFSAQAVQFRLSSKLKQLAQGIGQQSSSSTSTNLSPHLYLFPTNPDQDPYKIYINQDQPEVELASNTSFYINLPVMVDKAYTSMSFYFNAEQLQQNSKYEISVEQDDDNVTCILKDQDGHTVKYSKEVALHNKKSLFIKSNL